MSGTDPNKSILADPAFRGFISTILKLANSQYKQAVNEDVKTLAKTVFGNPADYVGINWPAEDPYRWSPGLQRQAQQLTYNQPGPTMMHNQRASGFVPINMGASSGSGLGGPSGAGNRAGGLNVFSNTQFPPLGSAPPPPPPPPSATSSSNPNVSNNSGTTTKQKKRKNTSLFPASSASSTSFDVSEEERLAKMKRARRFEREMELDKKREMGFGLPDDDDNDGMGMKVDLALTRMGKGKKKRNGRDWFGGAAQFEEEEPEADPNVINWDRYTIKGTSTNIEKSYLRLTSAPNPANIRPLHILQQSLENIRRKWDGNDKEYPWICDQLKSMRQDLTVQRIKNDFTVKVYEFHARVALLSGDLGEYNQCQSVLKQLYEHGLPGCAAEFLGYRILYMIHTKNMSELGRAIARLSPSQKKDPGIHHALAVHTAITTGNYHKLFQLFVKPVNLNADLMDHFVERERVAALAKISKSYMTIPFGFLARELGFTGDPDHRNHLELCQLLETHDAFIFSTSTAKYTIDQAFYAEGMKRPIDWEALEALVWNCKANAGACEAAVEKYKKVDIKGQK